MTRISWHLKYDGSSFIGSRWLSKIHSSQWRSLSLASPWASPLLLRSAEMRKLNFRWCETRKFVRNDLPPKYWRHENFLTIFYVSRFLLKWTWVYGDWCYWSVHQRWAAPQGTKIFRLSMPPLYGVLFCQPTLGNFWLGCASANWPRHEPPLCYQVRLDIEATFDIGVWVGENSNLAIRQVKPGQEKCVRISGKHRDSSANNFLEVAMNFRTTIKTPPLILYYSGDKYI